MPPTPQPRPSREERRQARQARQARTQGREPKLYRVQVLDADGTERVNNFAEVLPGLPGRPDTTGGVRGQVVTLQHDYPGVEPAPGWRVLVHRLGLDLRVTAVAGQRLECQDGTQPAPAPTEAPEQPRRRRKE